MVLTIDPAKRLANSLGLDQLGHTVQQVPQTLVHAGQHSGKGELFAMMLDQKAAFDEVVRTHAKDPDAIRRIMANPLYAQISGTLAGAQEYAAMAKLQEFDATGQYVARASRVAASAELVDMGERGHYMLKGAGEWNSAARTHTLQMFRDREPTP